jgi:hypothetical protein
LVPENVKQKLNKSVTLMSVCAAEYASNAVSHVVANFEMKSVLYFFTLFNKNNDISKLLLLLIAKRLPDIVIIKQHNWKLIGHQS